MIHAIEKTRHQNFLTDGGIETSLIYHDGCELPLFASYTLFENEEGRETILNYYRPYIKIASEKQLGFILESPTWRCSKGWGAQLGHSEARVAEFNRQAIAAMHELAEEAKSTLHAPILVSGCIGPAGDGYRVDNAMSPAEASQYHNHQIDTFATARVDMVSAITMTHIGEAAGIALAARRHGLPCVISFTVETDGRLPSGETVAEAIAEVDALSGDYPSYYMLNCAHPDHFHSMIAENPAVAERIGGVRANASRMSHAELDVAETLDDGDPIELASNYRALADIMPNLRVFGGCCGTDHRHIAAIADHCCA